MVDQEAPPPIADSPYFWFALFAAVGLAALIATGGKFGKRQAGIERRYQARTAAAQGLEVQTSAGGEKTAAAAPEYSTPGKLVISLWPLEITLAAICCGSFFMLLRQRSGAKSNPPPS